MEDEFDAETTAQSRVDRSTGNAGTGLAGSGDVERTFDAETVALSDAEGDGRAQEPVPAMATGVRPARSSWEKRQLLRGDVSFSSGNRFDDGQLDESFEEPLYPPPPPPYLHHRSQAHIEEQRRGGVQRTINAETTERALPQQSDGMSDISSNRRMGLPRVSELTGNGGAIDKASGRCGAKRPYLLHDWILD